jgi:hypothetical protein
MNGEVNERLDRPGLPKQFGCDCRMPSLTAGAFRPGYSFSNKTHIAVETKQHRDLRRI